MIYKIPFTTATIETTWSNNIILQYNDPNYLVIGSNILISDDVFYQTPEIIKQDIFKTRLTDEDQTVGLERSSLFKLPVIMGLVPDYLAICTSQRTALGSFNNKINPKLNTYYLIINHKKYKHLKCVLMITERIRKKCGKYSVSIDKDSIELAHYKIL